MTSPRWNALPIHLRVLQVLCFVAAGVAGLLIVLTEQTGPAWTFMTVAGLGNAFVQWRAWKIRPRPEPEIGRDSPRASSALDFLKPPRLRWEQLQSQLGGVPFEHVSKVAVESALGEVLAPKAASIRTSKVAALGRSRDYRVRIRIDGSAVKLTPSSTMYSWQPVFRGRAEQRESGSALVGTISWSGPTRFFTVAFPCLGLIFVIVGVVLGFIQLALGHFATASGGLAAVAFGIVFGGGSLVMSLWGASQARQDQSYLAEWLSVLLPPDESGRGSSILR